MTLQNKKSDFKLGKDDSATSYEYIYDDNEFITVRIIKWQNGVSTQFDDKEARMQKFPEYKR